MSKSGSAIILILLLMAVSYLSYTLYLNYFSPQQNFKADFHPELPSYSGDIQFAGNMRFSYPEISYYIFPDCPQDKSQDTRDAFNYLSSQAPILKFTETSSNADIDIKCGQEISQKGGFFIAGEGGPESYIDTGKFNVISKGEVLLLYTETCKNNRYNTALHEILHVLGFKHSQNSASLMYNVSSCNQILTSDIPAELERLYLIQPLPDLAFSEVSAIKHGIYADINLTVKNLGLVPADNVTVVAVLGSKNESLSLENIDIGAGKIFTVRNLQVPMKLNEIKLIIQGGTELDYSNNEAVLTLTD